MYRYEELCELQANCEQLSLEDSIHLTELIKKWQGVEIAIFLLEKLSPPNSARGRVRDEEAINAEVRELETKYTSLLKQVESMKCCGNCYLEDTNECFDYLGCNVCDNWTPTTEQGE